jgi:hypothetical protein
LAVKALFVHGGRDYWLDVARRMQDKYGWEIVGLTGMISNKESAKAKFPESIYFENQVVRDPDFNPNNYNIKPAAVHTDLLSKMWPYEAIFLKMLDRLMPTTPSVIKSAKGLIIIKLCIGKGFWTL